MLSKRCSCEDQSKCPHYWQFAYMLHAQMHRRSTRTADKRLAERIAAKDRGQALEGIERISTPKQYRLQEHLDDYIAHTISKNVTAYKDRAVLDRFRDSVGAKLLDGVTSFLCERWKQERAKQVSRSTVNRELHIVRGCFTRAVEWGRLKQSPVAAVKEFRVDDSRVRVLSPAEIRAALSIGGDVALICRTTLECLPRLSEVLQLRREHIGGSSIEFRRKGGKVTRGAATPALCAALLVRCHSSGFVFGERRGNPPTEQCASNRVVRALREVGVTGASHHTMRHTGVTMMLEAGANPRVIQMLAGWGSLRMLERYGHVRDAEVVRAVTTNAATLEAILATEQQQEEAK